jgi:hypothetical protein
MATGLIPVTDEQAKALQEGSKLAGQVVETVRDAGVYLARMLGTVPEDLVGLTFGDALHIKRWENYERAARKAEERLRDRGVTDTNEVPLSLGLPLIAGAAEENREELVDLWARLLAAAMDPSRSAHVSGRFIAILKAMDPVDARVLWLLSEGPLQANSDDPAGSTQVGSAVALGVNRDHIQMAFENLRDLKLVRPRTTHVLDPQADIPNVALTSAGREFLAAVRD